MFERRKDLSAYAQVARGAGHTARNSPTRVDCVIGGTQKGGTTALASYLYEHPQVSIPGTKEVHFFDTDAPFANGPVDYESYHAVFPASPSASLRCDATPIYMYWDPAPARIWQYNPAMKWIFVLRDPALRAFSHWNMQRIKGRDQMPFLDALRAERERCRAVLPYQHPWWSYLDRGYYAQQLRRVLRFFPARQLLVLKSEDLRETPQHVLERVAQFLGIAAFAPVQPRDVYAIPYSGDMHPAARRLLRDTFEYDVRDLERMFELDCAKWL